MAGNTRMNRKYGMSGKSKRKMGGSTKQYGKFSHVKSRPDGTLPTKVKSANQR